MESARSNFLPGENFGRLHQNLAERESRPGQCNENPQGAHWTLPRASTRLLPPSLWFRSFLLSIQKIVSEGETRQ